MSRRYVLGGNWKSNPASAATAKELCATFKGQDFDKGKVEVIICPTALHGSLAIAELGDCGVEVGIQNISKTGPGAFTGEVTAAMAAEMGYTWCLIGHSERRTLYGETIEDTCIKLKNAQEAGLKVMFCIGETLQERESGTTDQVNQTQLEPALSLVQDWDKVVVAYEPVWAIGTGKVATPEQAQETHAAIRKFLAAKLGEEIASKVRIQYGGSASPDNIEGLACNPDIDGFLVGGASLKPGFTKMISHLSGL
jgi:triosephosphate isomerase